MEQYIHTTSKEGKIEKVRERSFGSESKKEKVRDSTKVKQRK